MTPRSPLHSLNKRLGAKLVPFAGWEMPLQFSGVLDEHKTVREACGLFDVSHLGKLFLNGDRALAALDAILPGKVAALEPWQAGYNLVLTKDAGIVDDLFVYRTPDSVFLIPNAANAGRVAKTLRSHLPSDIDVDDQHERWAVLALQGPATRGLIRQIAPDLLGLALHRFAPLELQKVPLTQAWAARTGYTGEFGFEFVIPAESAEALFLFLMKAGEPHGIKPAGLGARDTLRLEMGYALHGHEITDQTNPIEAAMNWVIDWTKPRFVARDLLEAIKEQGPERKLVGLMPSGREIPREGYAVRNGPDEVGTVTSGNFSPTLQKGIALAYVRNDLAEAGTMLIVDVRGRMAEVEVVRPPFIER